MAQLKAPQTAQDWGKFAGAIIMALMACWGTIRTELDAWKADITAGVSTRVSAQVTGQMLQVMDSVATGFNAQLDSMDVRFDRIEEYTGMRVVKNTTVITPPDTAALGNLKQRMATMEAQQQLLLNGIDALLDSDRKNKRQERTWPRP